MILAGRVAVNGAVVTTLGARADTENDEVTLDGVPVRRERYRYVALNKPAGVLTTVRDDRGRRTVADLVDIRNLALHPVGRLDQESEGLLIMTNDGHLTDRLTHPRHEVEKEYLAGIDQPLGRSQRQRMVRGIHLDGEVLKADSVEVASPDGGEADPRWLLITLHHGRKREIRRILAALHRRVVTLRRVRIGPLALGALAPGEWRDLTDDEVAALYAASGGSANGATG